MNPGESSPHRTPASTWLHHQPIPGKTIADMMGHADVKNPSARIFGNEARKLRYEHPLPSWHSRFERMPLRAGRCTEKTCTNAA
jgi:hypothetical protein